MPQTSEVRHEIFKAAQRLAGESELTQQRREEIASIRNELELIRKDIAGLLRNGRSLILAELRKYGYNPQEPRIPEHQTGGGRWTRDPFAGQRYAAATQIVIHPNSLTGISRIDDTTKKLADLLAKVVDGIEPRIAQALYGIMVHTRFAAAVRAANLRGVEAESTFNLFSSPIYGSKYSKRPDAILRDDGDDIVAIYDVKTGIAGLRPSRVDELRATTLTTDDTYVIEMSIIRGTILKYNSIERHWRRSLDSREWMLVS